MRRLLAATTVAVLVCAGACGQILSSAPDDPTTDGGTSGANDGAALADVATSAEGCPSARGPAMVRVDIDAGIRFCIDSTEVTRDQYEAFLATKPVPAAQVAPCTGNASFKPNYPSDAGGDHPITNIDWCDAVAFCAWAGKRLCGDLDGGGALPLESAGQFKRSEWMAACTHFGTPSYSQNPTCNQENQDGGTWAVGSTKECVAGYPGIFDMIGNVTEFENACSDTDAGRRCANRGGSFRSSAACYFANEELPAIAGSDWGIRCCATPR